MGLRRRLTKAAVSRVSVLIVEVPGWSETRWAAERDVRSRGWRTAMSPADADVLLTCGSPGAGLSRAIELTWEQLPGPRARGGALNPTDAGAALQEAADQLLDERWQRQDAAQRGRGPAMGSPATTGQRDDDGALPDRGSSDHDGAAQHANSGDIGHSGHGDMSHQSSGGPGGTSHADMGHEGHGGTPHEDMGHQGHGDTPHEDMGHEGHGDTPHVEMGHEGHGDTTPEGHGDTPHEDMGHQGHGGMSHEGHGGMSHEGHGGMSHEGHGGMEMSPGGIPLASSGSGDRDGLDLDVLHVSLGPVLPCWPAGLLLHCTLHGDVVTEARPEVLAAAAGFSPASSLGTAADRLDRAGRLLALAGWDDAATAATRFRDAVVDGTDSAPVGPAVDRLIRRVRRSRTLRWSLHGLGVIDAGFRRRHGLDEQVGGDVYERLIGFLTDARPILTAASVERSPTPVALLPELVVGLELSAVRLVVASMDVDVSRLPQAASA